MLAATSLTIPVQINCLFIQLYNLTQQYVTNQEIQFLFDNFV